MKVNLISQRQISQYYKKAFSQSIENFIYLLIKLFLYAKSPFNTQTFAYISIFQLSKKRVQLPLDTNRSVNTQKKVHHS